MVIAVMALQGAFAEHEKMLDRLGVEWFEIRQRADWDRHKDGLILPGGESTTMLKLLNDLQLFDPVCEAIKNGLPVFGTCAGLILLAREVDNDQRQRFGTMDMVVRRNAYGRQLGSFRTLSKMKGIDGEIPMTFIRAPFIVSVSGEAEALAVVDGNIVAARQGNQLAVAFHPELDDDLSIHRYFISIVAASSH